jgi:hypothetical protein
MPEEDDILMHKGIPAPGRFMRLTRRTGTFLNQGCRFPEKRFNGRKPTG